MLNDFDKRLAPAVVINLSAIVLTFIAKRFLPPVVPLFYGLPLGEEQLVQTMFLVIPAVVSLIIVVANALVARFVKSVFLQSVLFGLVYATTILSTITIIKIILLIGPF